LWWSISDDRHQDNSESLLTGNTQCRPVSGRWASVWLQPTQPFTAWSLPGTRPRSVVSTSVTQANLMPVMRCQISDCASSGRALCVDFEDA
jgi:hypothetical protein